MCTQFYASPLRITKRLASVLATLINHFVRLCNLCSVLQRTAKGNARSLVASSHCGRSRLKMTLLRKLWMNLTRSTSKTFEVRDLLVPVALCVPLLSYRVPTYTQRCCAARTRSRQPKAKQTRWRRLIASAAKQRQLPVAVATLAVLGMNEKYKLKCSFVACCVLYLR